MFESGFMGERNTRRLPVYLLLDCSTSMTGEPILAVNDGLGLIYRLLMTDPQAVETVHISVICFSNQVMKTPLEPIEQFQPPMLVANGMTNMGEAFRALAHSIESELVLNTATQRGDYRPLVFLLTDGEPTDDYVYPLQDLQALRGSRRPTIVALGCGHEANTQMLHQVTDNVFLMETVSGDAIREFFKWISGSVTQASRSVGAASEQTLTMPPPSSIPGITWSPN